VSVCKEQKKNSTSLLSLKRINRIMKNNNNSFVQAAIPKFDGHYDHWAMLMKNFLGSKEYWDLIENGMSMEVTQRIEPGSVSMVGAIEGQHKLSEDRAEAQRKLIEG